VSFIVGNADGSPAELGIGEFQADAFLTLGPGTCGGALEPFSTCSVEISFDPGEPGTYEGSLVVEDASTGDQLQLSVTGIAGTIDLQVVFASDAVRTTGCPDDEPVCLAFLVLNAGTAASPAAIAEVESGETRLRVDVPPLEAGAQVELVAGTGPSCTNDCGASVVVDPAALVPESDEQNNTDSYTEVG
jgi:CARDB